MRKICVIVISLISLWVSHAGLQGVIYDIPGTAAPMIASTTSLANLSFEVLQAQVQLSNIQKTLGPQDSVLATIQSAEMLAQQDIIQLLNISTDKQATLRNYLEDTSKQIESTSRIQDYLTQNIALTQGDMNACIIDKKAADQEYFADVQAYDEAASERTLTTAIIADQCATEKRILSNANVYLLNKLNYLQNIIQQKQKIIESEQDNILQHFDVMSPSILQKLNTITQSLASYQL